MQTIMLTDYLSNSVYLNIFFFSLPNAVDTHLIINNITKLNLVYLNKTITPFKGTPV
jgi:hypothetical protein